MNPAHLDPAAHPWLRAPEVCAVLDALDATRRGATRFVGGCVRNAVMGRPVDDLDLATQLTPGEVIGALEACGLKAVPTGLEHGTVTAVASGRPFEITTLRRDVETHGRRAVVAFTDDWNEDARRRDFRLNAIYADRDGALFDPQDGIADAKAGRIVFIGDARARIREDYLRILRFYRFNAWYGQGPVDAAGHAACLGEKAGLKTLSAERVWKELKRLLAAPDPASVIETMQKGHVFELLLPGELDLQKLLRLVKLDGKRAAAPDPLIRMAALAGGPCADARAAGRGREVDALQNAMRLSNAEAGRLSGFAAACGAALGDGPSRRAAFYEHGADGVCGAARLMEAEGALDAASAGAVLEEAARWRRPVFPVRAKDLIARGAEPGPALGAMLTQLEAEWIASDFKASRDALLARAGCQGGQA